MTEKKKPLVPRRHLKIVGEPGKTQVIIAPPQATITQVPTVEAHLLHHQETPGMMMLKLIVEGKELWIPCFPTNSAEHVMVRVAPFMYRRTAEEAEALHQEVAAQKRAQAASALWTPEKQRKGLLH